MSWLNLNESLNNIKGQISNFANNVLTETEENPEISKSKYEELKQIYQNQEREILQLRKIKQQFPEEQAGQGSQIQNGESITEDKWDWDLNKEPNFNRQEDNSASEVISDLKKQIKAIENEKNDLINQLELLDSENQQNVSELVSMRDRLIDENHELKEKCLQINHKNKSLTHKEEKIRKEYNELQRQFEEFKKNNLNSTPQISQEGFKDKQDVILLKNQKLKVECDDLKNEISLLKSTSKTLEKTLEDLTKSAERDISEFSEKHKRAEAENKIIYAELQKSKDTIKQYEITSAEDAENCKKLALILESYETQVGSLKSEIEILKKDSITNRRNSKVDDDSDILKLNEELAALKSRYDNVLLERDAELTHSNAEIEHLKYLNEEKQKELSVQQSVIKSLEDKISNITAEYEKVNDERDILQLNEELEKLRLEKEEKSTLATSYQAEILSLKKRLEQSELDSKQFAEHHEELLGLKENSDKVTLDHQNALKELSKLKDIFNEKDSALKKSGEEVSALKQEVEDQRVRLETNLWSDQDYQNLNEKYEDLKSDYMSLLSEKENLHNRYVNTITETVKNLFDSENSGFLHSCIPDDPQMSDFSKQIENILKILLDFKNKCEALEKEIYELSEEKTTILNEKNHEIEKLIQNSEILSQEVITKSDAIKYYENECSELIKNNELLISELDTYKNNSGLQTISESNEDNMVLLEGQLENANKRISELEKRLEESERDNKTIETHPVSLIDITDTEVSNKKKDYQDLLNNFDDLQIELRTLKNDLEKSKEEIDYTSRENENLKVNLERVRADFENTEYQLQESTVLVDSLKEELESTKIRMNDFFEANKKLQLLNTENEKLTADLNSELNMYKENLISEENNRKTLEVQVRNLTEKLQNAKMAETSLKLQLENLNKDFCATVEAKHTLEAMLNNINESIKTYEQNYTELQAKYEETLVVNQQLKDIELKQAEELKILKEELQSLKEKKITDTQEEKAIIRTEEVESMPETDEVKILVEEKNNLQLTINNLQTTISESQEKIASLELQLQQLNASRNELIAMVTTKHQESMTYHNEIQRLSQVMQVESEKCKALEAKLQNTTAKEDLQKKDEQIEKLSDQNSFLKEKCDILAKNLLEEQCKIGKMLEQHSKPSEMEVNLNKKLERLQTHLVEVEEHYTQELLQAEQKNADLQSKLNDVEQREKTSSTMYTSVSIRANQQVEVLQNQLQMVSSQRDELRRKISDAEDVKNKQAAALANLQFVLQQFQRDKEKDVHKETERIRRQVTAEKQVQEELRKEISNLKLQLEETKQGLQAAARLSDQLENSKKQITALKEEVHQHQEKLSNTEDQLRNITSQTDGKVDKGLVKNLLIGFVSSNSHSSLNKDQLQILKIITTVLDFNQQDHDKIKLNTQPQGSWLSSLLSPQGCGSSQNMSHESLSQAFIKFLENESTPRVVPSLLTSETPNSSNRSSDNSKRNSPRQSPIVLSEIVLPTFADFAQNRNSSSILKDVLKDNSG